MQGRGYVVRVSVAQRLAWAAFFAVLGWMIWHGATGPEDYALAVGVCVLATLPFWAALRLALVQVTAIFWH